MTQALDKTFQILRQSSDENTVDAVLGSALREPYLANRALDSLLDSENSRAPREIARNFAALSPELGKFAIDKGAEKLLIAAQQLIKCGKPETRRNVATLLTEMYQHRPTLWSSLLPLILTLIDDVQPTVADHARNIFLLGMEEQSEEHWRKAFTPKHPVMVGFQILLRRFAQHRDRKLLSTLFNLGQHGQDLLDRAIGENWTASPALKEEITLLGHEDLSMAHYVAGLLRWSNGPFAPSREFARGILRDRLDSPLLIALADRFEQRDSNQRDNDSPMFRHIHWQLLPAEALQRYSDRTLEKIAGYLNASTAKAPEKVRHLGRLLKYSGQQAQKSILAMLKELPSHAVAPQLETALESKDLEVQLSATEMLQVDGSRQSFLMLIKQLAHGHHQVRSAAQRKIAGQGLALFFTAFETLKSIERQRVLPILEKVDPHFVGELRRALRSHEEREVILALRTIDECDRALELQESLLEITHHPSSRVRATLAHCLAKLKGEASLHYLRIYLEDKDERVVANAIEGFGSLHEQRSAPWISKFQNHDNARIRTNTWVAMHQLGDSNARQQLLRQKASGSTDGLRASARWALEHLKLAS